MDNTNGLMDNTSEKKNTQFKLTKRGQPATIISRPARVIDIFQGASSTISHLLSYSYLQ